MPKSITNYTSRITNYNSSHPNFMTTLAASLQPLVDVDGVVSSLPADFDIDTAVGAQLDVVGQWVNLSRKVNVPIPNPWFSFGDISRGWGRGIWKQPYDTGTTAKNLDDDAYRRILKARIGANLWDGTTSEAYSVLVSFFEAGGQTKVIVDDKNQMQVIYALSRHIPDSVSLELFRGNYLPLSPAGVKTYHFVSSVDNTPIFGFGLSNSKIAGWGGGSWGTTPDYLLANPPSAFVFGTSMNFKNPKNSSILALVG